MKRFVVYTASLLAVPLLVGGGMLAITGHCSSPKVEPPALTDAVTAPARALSDGPNAVPLDQFGALLDQLLAIWRVARGAALEDPVSLDNR